MRTILSTLILTMTIATLYAQSVERQVISPFGLVSDGDVAVEATIGEAIIFSYEGSVLRVNAGFHVGDDLTSTPTIDLPEKSIDVKFFPIPTRDYVNLKIEEADSGIKYYSIHDMTGKLIRKERIENAINIRIDMTDFRSGQYGILLHTDKSSHFGSWVIKVD